MERNSPTKKVVSPTKRLELMKNAHVANA